jgi:hypothetical protein
MRNWLFWETNGKTREKATRSMVSRVSLALRIHGPGSVGCSSWRWEPWGEKKWKHVEPRTKSWNQGNFIWVVWAYSNLEVGNKKNMAKLGSHNFYWASSFQCPNWWMINSSYLPTNFKKPEVMKWGSSYIIIYHLRGIPTITKHLTHHQIFHQHFTTHSP